MEIEDSVYNLIDEIEKFISDNYPNVIFHNSDRKSLILYLVTKNYITLMYVFGYKFLMILLELFELKENYEECKNIVDGIQKHNTLLNDNLSTTYKI